MPNAPARSVARSAAAPGARVLPLVAQVVAVALVLVLVLAACVPAKEQSSATVAPETTGEATTAPPEELAAYYGQELAWSECAEAEECATLRVPIDYADPSGGDIELALARYRGSDERIGSLVLNPGGPGSSGVDFLSYAHSIVSPAVTEAYDLVAFDPRGVQRSQPILCIDAPEMDELLAWDPDYSTPEGIQQAVDRFAQFSQDCLDRTGPQFGHADTVSAARDIDILRAALGDDTLHYLGYSYGTQLGATYASLFPERAGRLVLDGAVDPTLSAEELTLGQAGGFESALRAYVTDCQAGADCPLTGSLEDGLQQVRDLLDRARADPLPTGTDRRLTQSLAFSGVAVALYSEDYWPYLSDALALALQANDGSGLLVLADLYNDREEDGTFSSNSREAFWGIGCLDDRISADPDDMADLADQLVAEAPTVGSFFAYGGTLCADWAVPEVGGLDDYTAEGAAPILVIGTTNDPATPYHWAQSLAKTLESGTLLTYEGEGHTAYGRSNACVAEAVDGFLLDGLVPPDGTTC